MTNNDILRRLRFVFNFTDAKMIHMFAKVKFEMSETELLSMLKKDDESGFRPCSDVILCRFLDGLIIEKRGLKPGAELPTPTKLNNNLIFKKLRIALEMKEEDIMAALSLASFNISKSELGALFRNPDHRHFKVCGDQILRNFIKGLSIKYRGK